MTRSPILATLFGVDLRLHGSWALLVPGVIGYTLWAESWQATLFFSVLLVTTALCVVLHEAMQVFVARRFGIGTRDVTLYPLWGVIRFTQRSERPWQENYIALTGPFTFLLLAGIIGATLYLAGLPLALQAEAPPYHVAGLILHLFWVNILLALFHFLPFLPLDAGMLFRAALAMTTTRLRASEVATGLTSVGAAALFAVALFWLHSPLVAFMAVLLFFAAQEDVRTERFFASLAGPDGEPLHAPPMLTPVEQLINQQCQPQDEAFTGFTWNPHLRLWIEWRNGEPIRANALIGE